jgi:glycosyltransferase involved in cell wall biosynthesis
VDVTVLVGTFGDDSWRDLGEATALEHDALHVHAGDLAAARNIAAGQATSEWIVFLDAGDQLATGYLEALDQSDADLRAPRLFVDGTEVQVADRDIRQLNPCCIGTAVRRSMFIAAGGFLAEPIYEDWSLWLRCVRLGATIGHTAAEYHAAPSERNVQPLSVRQKAYADIRRKWAA